MSNYNNIKPYADFSHKVAPFGGPEQYVKKVADKNFAAGVQAEKSTELGKGAVLLTLGLAAWEGGKFAVNKYKQYRQKKATEAMAEAQKANEECVKVLKEEIEKEATADTSDVQSGEGLKADVVDGEE